MVAMKYAEKHYLCEVEKELEIVEDIRRNIDVITAALLLTGQITILRIIVGPGHFSMSVGGPLTGRERLEGKFGNEVLSLLLDIGDILIAILLIKDELNVEGLFITPGGFSFNVTGPIFGFPKLVATLPDMERIYNQFKFIVSDHFNIDPRFFVK
jgi:hypothetical protein